MHVLFRTLAQQMGMQKVRGILKESIDTFINTAIIHTVQTEIRTNVGASFKENIATQRNKISTSNALSTLYIQEVITINITDGVGNNSVELAVAQNPMYFIDFALGKTNNKFVSCRWIESDKVEETSCDYCNRDSEQNPIVSVDSKIVSDTVKRYCNVFTGGHNSSFTKLKVGYVRMPKTVELTNESTQTGINCDLPEYLHQTIVETAVELYMNSLGLTSNKQTSNQNNN